MKLHLHYLYTMYNCTRRLSFLFEIILKKHDNKNKGCSNTLNENLLIQLWADNKVHGFRNRKKVYLFLYFLKNFR